MAALPRFAKPFAALPAPLLNGLSVGVGLACLTTLIGVTAGLPAAITAASGATVTSVADTVCPPQAKRDQMVPAVISSSLVAALVAFSHPYPALMTAVLLSIVLTSIMWMSWGKRGGPQTFVMVLTLVFQMAAFNLQSMDWPHVWRHLGWVMLGSLGMAAWSELSIRVLAQRYRTLALVDGLNALAAMMRAQAQWTRQQLGRSGQDNAQGLLALITQQAGMADVLQHARDMLYSQADQDRASPIVQAQAQALIHTVNLRDVVQACQLDLDRMPSHAHVDGAITVLADQLATQAQRLQDMAQCCQEGRPWLPKAPASTSTDSAHALQDSADSHPVLHSLARRSLHMQSLMDSIEQTLAPTLSDGAPANTPTPISVEHRAIMLTLVSPSNWSLAPLKAQLTWQSPILRYAIRATLAVACAYALAHVMPWTSHPHWILMTVAVVMRGNLEQTLARRDARIQGTLVGCLIASGLISGLDHSAWLFFVLAVSLSLAHGFVNINYRITAASGAVLALVQGHLFTPGHHPALVDAAERMADTLIGAGLAWAFSYVLPSWERQQLPRMVARLLHAQAHYTHHALRWHLDHPKSSTRSHARREVYDVLWLLAQSLQRMGKEPRYARQWAQPLETLLIHSHRLISHLAGIKGLLTVRHQTLQAEVAVPALATAEQCILACLHGQPAEPPNKAPDQQPILTDTDLPGDAPSTAWLLLRLDQTQSEAKALAAAARQWAENTSPHA